MSFSFTLTFSDDLSLYVKSPQVPTTLIMSILANLNNAVVWMVSIFPLISIALSAGAVEYTDCFSAEGKAPPNECPGYDIKQSDGEVPAMQELWGMRSTPSLPSIPGPLWPGIVAPDRALSMG